MARCAGCSRTEGVTVLDSGVVLRSASGTRTVIERVTLCPPSPRGCGTRRVQRETHTVEDLGPTGKRYASRALKHGAK